MTIEKELIDRLTERAEELVAENYHTRAEFYFDLGTFVTTDNPSAEEIVEYILNYEDWER